MLPLSQKGPEQNCHQFKYDVSNEYLWMKMIDVYQIDVYP